MDRAQSSGPLISQRCYTQSNAQRQVLKTRSLLSLTPRTHFSISYIPGFSFASSLFPPIATSNLIFCIGAPQLSFLSSNLFFTYTLSIGNIIQALYFKCNQILLSLFYIDIGSPAHSLTSIIVYTTIWWTIQNYVQNVLSDKIWFSSTGPHVMVNVITIYSKWASQKAESFFCLTIFHQIH